jgi:hypothetical protein
MAIAFYARTFHLDSRLWWFDSFTTQSPYPHYELMILTGWEVEGPKYDVDVVVVLTLHHVPLGVELLSPKS